MFCKQMQRFPGEHNSFVREREWFVRECKCFQSKRNVSQGNTIVCHKMQIFCETAIFLTETFVCDAISVSPLQLCKKLMCQACKNKCV